jgi:hypothetical protein
MNTDRRSQSSSLSNLDRLLNSKPTTTLKPKATNVKLHKYVWGLVGVFGLFFGSFPFAYARVANSDSFEQQPVHSIAWGDNQKDNLVYPEPK